MLINRISKKNCRHGDYRQFEIYTIESFLHTTTNGSVHLIFEETYSMIWIEMGCGEITIDLAKFEIGANTIYYVKPGQALALEIEECSKGFIICFDREFFELYEKKASELINTALFNNYLEVPVINVGNEINGFMKCIAEEMLQEYKNYYDLRLEILKGLLKIFIIYLSRKFDNDYQSSFYSRKMVLVNSFFMMLDKDFTIKKQVKEYAELLAVTPNYLNDIIKEISGFTAGYHIQQKIILEAKRRAIFDGYSLKEIAYKLGFIDPSHFSRYFKNSSGTNFTDFKKGISNFVSIH